MRYSDLQKSSKVQVIEDMAHGFDNEMFISDSADSIKLLSFGRSRRCHRSLAELYLPKIRSYRNSQRVRQTINDATYIFCSTLSSV